MTPREAHFWPQGHYLNKLGREPLDDATNQILRFLGPVVSDKKIFSCFPYIEPM